MKIATWKKSILFDSNLLDNRFKFFTCTNCGKVEILSDRVTFQEIKSSKRKSKSKSKSRSKK